MVTCDHTGVRDDGLQWFLCMSMCVVGWEHEGLRIL